MDDKMIYVSVTGLELKSWLALPQFWFYAFRSMTQARKAPGNLSADVRQIHGVQHTVTTWKSRADMLAFVHSGIHKRAVAAFPALATGKTLGFVADHAPPWEDVPALWREKGRDYQVPKG